jgi:catechol 2,3-dioxygenase-like lactoylglutathione lyase family enzyme
MPKINGVLETSLYVDDLPRSVQFYTTVLGFDVVDSGERLCALRIAGQQLLLLCKKGASATLEPGGHDGDGRLHLALAISEDEIDEWDLRLQQHGVSIEERHEWELGGRSLYFRDPDQHILELATPGVWTIY